MKKAIKYKPFVMPLLAILAFICFSCLNLRTSIWFDEAYSSYITRGSYSDIWEMTSIDVHPPFYYYCLKTWSLIFGTSDFAMRSMSVFFAAIGIILAYFLLKRWFNWREAGLCTIFLSFSPFLIRYSQEARMYGVVFAIVMGATLVLDVALKTKKKWAWAIYALLISLGMWTHYFCALAWIAHLAFVIYYMCKHRELQKSVFWTYPLAVALFLPWLPSFYTQFNSVQNGFWIPEVSFLTPLSLLSLGFLEQEPEETKGWLTLLLVATITAVIILAIKTLPKFKKEESENVTFLSFMVFLPPLLLILLSLPPFKPTFVARYVTYSIALFMALVGLLVARGSQSKPKYLAPAVMLLVACCVAYGIYSVDTRTNDNPTKDIIVSAEANSEDDTPILIDTDEMNYYDAFFYETPEHPVYGINIDFKWGSLEPIRKYGINYKENVVDIILNKDEFWYITQNKNKRPSFAGYEVVDDFDNKDYKAYKLTRKRSTSDE